MLLFRNKNGNGDKLDRFGQDMCHEADAKQDLRGDPESIKNREKRNKKGAFNTAGHSSMCGAAEKQPGATDAFQVVLDEQLRHKKKISTWGDPWVQKNWGCTVVAPVLNRCRNILENHQQPLAETMQIYFDTQQYLGVLNEDSETVRVLRYSAGMAQNVNPEGGKKSPLHRHRDHAYSGLVVLVSLRNSCDFYVGQSTGNHDTVPRPKRGATAQEMAAGGQVLRLNHGDILVFDASRTENGSGLVHGVDKIIPDGSWRERISIQWRQNLGNRHRQMRFAWAMTNVADFEKDKFLSMFALVGVATPRFVELDQDRIRSCNYLSTAISSTSKPEGVRTVLFQAVSSICEANPKKYLSSRVGPCFKCQRSSFGQTWHLGKGGRTSVTDIADSVFSGFVCAPRRPGAKRRDARIELPILPRVAHF